VDGYVRVSRRGGRAGPSYISPDVQEEKIRGWAELHKEDVKLDEVVVEEDVSGKVKVDDRQLGRLIRKCESGESDGVIVYRVDRFARNALECLHAVQRLKEADARLVGVMDGVDSSAPAGRLILTILAGLAELQWEQYRENWEISSEEAVKRGVHIASKPPLGYRRRDVVDPTYYSDGKLIKDGSLVLDPVVAPLVRNVFKMRAAGASYQKCTYYLAENGITLDRTSIHGILKNPAYKGEARGPRKKTNPTAHDPIVTAAEWEAVQGKGKQWPKTGSVAGKALLQGVVCCAQCGHRLGVSPGSNQAGRKWLSYVCRTCRPGPSAMVEIVDTYVVGLLEAKLEANDPALLALLENDEHYAAAQEAVTAAQEELDAYVEAADAKLLGRDAFRRGAEVRNAALQGAKQALAELPPRDDAPLARNADGSIDLASAWKTSQKEMLRRGLVECVLSRAGKRGRSAPPIEQRLRIRWAGDESTS
jgi:DNA invertase Pin-like site-specific DNA recombinase